MQPQSFEERINSLEHQMHEMRDLPDRVTKLELQIQQFRQEVRDEFSATRTELRAEIVAAVRSLRDAIVETNTYMRMLHEEALARIATVGEGRRGRRKP